MENQQPSFPRITLYQYPARFDLPSLDPDCNVIVAYLRFVGVPFVTVFTYNPPTTSLPAICVEENNANLKDTNKNLQYVTGVDEIIEYMQTKVKNLDYDLNDEQKAESFSFSRMIKRELKDAWMYHCWLRPNNLQQTSVLYGKGPIPYTLNFPGQNFASVQSSLVSLYRFDLNFSVYKRTSKCYKSLSMKLGDSPYFYGNSPHIVDAFVFGYLALHTWPGFSENELLTRVSKFPNLVFLCSRVLKYFRNVGEQVSLGGPPSAIDDNIEDYEMKEKVEIKFKESKFIRNGVILLTVLCFVGLNLRNYLRK